jgi:hypothetical protein
LIVMFAPRATPVALFEGLVLVTAGALSASQKCGSAKLFRGFGLPTEKSALLLSVSAQPWPFRNAAVVLLRFPVGLPSEQVVPEP